MIVRRIALGTAFVAGALALAGCSMSIGPLPSSTAPAMPAAPAAPTAPTAPAAPAMPAAPNAQAAAAALKPIIMGNLMSASLNAASSVPPNLSSGSGQATIKLDGETLSWSVTYTGLTGAVTAGHFHGPAAPGANAGVVVPFAGSLASPIVGNKVLTPEQLAQLRAGLWYINLHTASYPGGEIRGQVR